MDFPVVRILANMKAKSQETICLIDPHTTYLNVRVIKFQLFVNVEKKTAG